MMGTGRGTFRRHSRRCVVACVSVFALVAAACGNDDAGSPAAGTGDGTASPSASGDVAGGSAPDGSSDSRTVRIALSTDIPTVDVHLGGNSPIYNVYANLYEALVGFDGTGTEYPVLAAELPTQIEDDRWRVKLREGVTFNNGEAFNAEAVAANVERMTAPETASSFISQIETITGTEIVDEYTIDILTDGFDVVLPARLSYIYMMAPSVVSDPSLIDDGAGTGPYEIESWDPATQITLTRNDGYWGDAPTIDRAEFVFLQEPGTRVAALLSDEVDIATDLPPDDAPRVPKTAYSSDQSVVMWLPNSSPDTTTGNVLVRRAMQHAIDREAIANDLYGGDAEVIKGVPLVEAWFGFDPDAPDYEYDPELAASLVEEAGAEGAKIRLVNDAGRWPRVDDIVQILQAAWTSIGLDVEVDNIDGSAWVDVLIGAAPRPEAMILQTTNEFFDASLLGSKYLSPDSVRVTHDDQELKEILDQANGTSVAEDRLALYKQAIEINHDNAYALPIVASPSNLVGMAEAVQWEPGIEARTIVAEMDLE